MTAGELVLLIGLLAHAFALYFGINKLRTQLDEVKIDVVTVKAHVEEVKVDVVEVKADVVVVKENVEVIHKATNSLKDELVEEVRKASFAAGIKQATDQAT